VSLREDGTEVIDLTSPSDQPDRDEGEINLRPIFSITGVVDGVRDELIYQPEEGDDTDGWKLRPVVVECKHRMRSGGVGKNSRPPPLYDIIQAVVYCFMFDADVADLVEVYRSGGGGGDGSEKGGTCNARKLNKKTEIVGTEKDLPNVIKGAQMNSENDGSTKQEKDKRLFCAASKGSVGVTKKVTINDSVEKQELMEIPVKDIIFTEEGIDNVLDGAQMKSENDRGTKQEKTETLSCARLKERAGGTKKPPINDSFEIQEHAEISAELAVESEKRTLQKDQFMKYRDDKAETLNILENAEIISKVDQIDALNNHKPCLKEISNDTVKNVKPMPESDPTNIFQKDKTCVEEKVFDVFLNAKTKQNPPASGSECSNKNGTKVANSDARRRRKRTDTAVEISVSRVSLDDEIMRHRQNWHEEVLPRLISFVKAVYSVRRDEGRRRSLLFALASEGEETAVSDSDSTCLTLVPELMPILR